MLCCFACQQGHFWSFILLIPTGGPCILNSKVSTHFCLLARVCQHTFFLTHSTLNYNSTKMLAKSPFSQSASYTRMSLRYSLTELISFFFYHCNIYDYLIQTFLFNSMSSPFSCLVPYFWLLFSISTWSDIHSPTASSFVKPFFHTAWTTFSEHFIFFSSKTVIDFCCLATPNSAVCLDISRPVKSSPSLLNLFF